MVYLIFNKDNRIVGVTEYPEVTKEFEYQKLHIIPAPEYLKECHSDEQRIAKLFNDAEFYYEWGFDSNGDVFVNILWGDWKHQHLFCSELMNAVGYSQTSVVQTDEDGSDCYSAFRTYKKIKTAII